MSFKLISKQVKEVVAGSSTMYSSTWRPCETLYATKRACRMHCGWWTYLAGVTACKST